MKRVSVVLLLSTLLLTVAAAFAQMPPPPAPELKKLDYFVGSWTMDGDMKPGPMGPGGKVSGTATYKWMDGGYFLTSDSTFSGVMGSGTSTAFYGYDSDKKTYIFDSFNTMGQHDKATGTIDGDTLTWLFDINAGGMTIKARYAMKMAAPTSCTYKLEFSQDGTSWILFMDGKATKK